MISTILLGAIFVAGFGFNVSSEFGKVYEVSIDCFDENKLQEFEQETKKVLKSYKYSATEVLVEDRSYCDTIIVRYKSTSQANATLIEKDIETKLNLNENLVSVSALSYSSETATAVKLLLPMGLIAIVIFAYSLFRYKWKFAVTLLLNYIFATCLPLALLAITRIELSITVLGVIALLAMLSTVLTMAIYSKMQIIAKHQQKPESFKNNYIAYISDNKFKAIIPSALILLLFTCLIFTFSSNLVFVGLSGIVSLIVSAYTTICFAPAFFCAIAENSEVKKQPVKDKE